MKFVKGMMIGVMATAGIAMMYMDSTNKTKRTIMKKGKQMAKKMGIMQSHNKFLYHRLMYMKAQN